MPGALAVTIYCLCCVYKINIKNLYNIILINLLFKIFSIVIMKLSIISSLDMITKLRLPLIPTYKKYWLIDKKYFIKNFESLTMKTKLLKYIDFLL